MRKITAPIIFTLIILSSISIGYSSFAGNVLGVSKEEIVNVDDLTLSDITYKNETNQVEKIKVSVSSYDAKNESILTTKPFIALGKTSYTVAAKSEVKIQYATSIPSNTPIGTYFNVIFIEKVTSTKDNNSNVAIKPTIGALLTFHVQDSSTTIDKVFFNDSDVQLRIVQKGLPYISPTIFTYTYTNNSNFVFKPLGEIRVLSTDEQQVLERFEINEEGKTLYPGESIEKTYEVTVWKSIQDVFSQRNIVSRTYSNIDSTAIMNKVSISILYQSIIIAVVGVTIVSSIIYFGVRGIVVAANSKRERVQNL